MEFSVTVADCPPPPPPHSAGMVPARRGELPPLRRPHHPALLRRLGDEPLGAGVRRNDDRHTVGAGALPARPPCSVSPVYLCFRGFPTFPVLPLPISLHQTRSTLACAKKRRPPLLLPLLPCPAATFRLWMATASRRCMWARPTRSTTTSPSTRPRRTMWVVVVGGWMAVCVCVCGGGGGGWVGGGRGGRGGWVGKVPHGGGM
jgi:hypothetical protein